MEKAKEQGIRAWYEGEFAPWQRKVADMEAMQADQQKKLQAHLPELQALVGMLLDGKTTAAVALWNRLGIHPALRGIEVAKGGGMLTVQEAGGAVREVPVGDVVRLIEGLK